jgi:hypothetical protein
MRSAMELCHKFETCSSPICTLDKDKKLRVRLAEDEDCSVSYNTRSRYRRHARKMGLL